MTASAPAIRGVIFDLDGTLIDSLEDIANAMNAALGSMGYPAHPLSAYRYFVGEGVKHLVECAIPPEHRKPDDVDTFLAFYRDHYREQWKGVTRIYHGLPGVLDRLRDAGLPLAVLSNKPHDLTVDCVNHFLAPWPFDPVYGQRDEIPRKPDPAAALDIARHWGLDPAAIAFVGDTRTDMNTAHAAGMIAVGVTWGFRPEQELVDHRAAHLARTPADLLRILPS